MKKKKKSICHYQCKKIKIREAYTGQAEQFSTMVSFPGDTVTLTLLMVTDSNHKNKFVSGRLTEVDGCRRAIQRSASDVLICVRRKAQRAASALSSGNVTYISVCDWSRGSAVMGYKCLPSTYSRGALQLHK